MKGYQLLLDSEFLNRLMSTSQEELAFAGMHWLLAELSKDTAINQLPIEIDIVKVTFHGSVFPGIGVHYLNQKPNLRLIDQDDTPDYGPMLEARLEEIYKSGSFSSFVEYVQQHQAQINQGFNSYKIEE